MKKSELKEFIKSSLLREDEDSKKGNKEEQERMEGAIRDDRDHIKDLEKDIKDNEDKLSKLKKDFKDDVNETTLNEFGDGKDYNEQMREIANFMRGLPREDHEDYLTKIEKFVVAMKKRLNEEDLDEAMRGEEVDEAMRGEEIDEGMRGSTYEEDDLKEAEEEDVNVDVEDDVNVDVDVEDDVTVDDVSDKSEIEVDSELAGEDSETAAVLGLLTKAQEKAKGMGDEKLLDQIGNTITYYTRAHVVATNEVELDVTGGESDVAGVLDAESALNLQEVQRFKKLAGLIK